MPNFPNTQNNDAQFLRPRGNKEYTLNKHASFRATLLKCADLTFLGFVGHLLAFKWISNGLLQSLLTLC